MINYIEIDVPQLVILPELNFQNIAKEFKDKIGQYYLLSYLGEKFTDFSIRHYIMNEQIKEIFLIHTEQVESRIKNEMYSMDKSHYTQLFYTEQVCNGIALIVAHLCYCIYFMKNLQTTGTIPSKTEISLAVDFIMNTVELKEQFSKFVIFIAETEEFRQSNGLNIVRPGYDFFLTEKEPVYFVSRKDGSLSIRLLRTFIEGYNQFFLTSKNVLRHHSPEAIGHDLEKWDK